jgi:hypothetical protein
MRLLATALCSLVLLACPKPVDPMVDSGMPWEDAGQPDAGRDAGRTPRDAGVDAGWVNVPEADWCRANATAKCWRDIRCVRIGEARLDTCVQTRSFGCDTNAYLRGSAEGRHLYDPIQAARCLNAYDRGSCETTPSECDTVFTGLVGGDGGAYVREDCEPDSGFFDQYDNRCPHRCAPWANLGERCSDNSGLFSPSCRPWHGCENYDAGFDRICMEPHLEGDDCRSFDSCALGLVCTGGKCVRQYADAGQACDVMNGYPFCDGESFCRQPPPDMMGMQPPGICQRKAGLGGVCAGYGSCQPSLRCSSTIGTGTCTKRLGLGEPCSSNVSIYPDCQEGLYCPNATSRCAPLPADGGDCSDQGSYFECAAGYYCDGFPAYICRPLRADGQACGYNAQCLSNECQYGMFPDAGNGYRCVRCSQMADGGP